MKNKMSEFTAGMYIAKLSKDPDAFKHINNWVLLKYIENLEVQWGLESKINDTSK